MSKDERNKEIHRGDTPGITGEVKGGKMTDIKIGDTVIFKSTGLPVLSGADEEGEVVGMNEAHCAIEQVYRDGFKKERHVFVRKLREVIKDEKGGKWTQE